MATVKKILEIEVDVESGDVKVLNSELKKTKKSFKDNKEASGEFSEKLFTVGNAIKGLGISIAIAGLAKLSAAFQKNQKIADKTEDVVNGIDVAFSKLSTTVAGSASGVVDYFKKLLIVALPVGKSAFVIAESVGKQITKNRKELALLEVDQRKLQLLNQQNAELERQKRDDSTLSFKERFEANDRLATQLDEAIKKEKEVTLRRIENVEFLQSDLALGYSFERELEIKNLRVELLDIEERITGVKSEQQAAERSLMNERKAAQEQAKREAAERLKANQEEFDALFDELENQMEKEGNLSYEKRRAIQHREEEAKAIQREKDFEAEKEYFQKLEELSDDNFEKTLSDQDLEIRFVQDKYFTLIELAEKYGQDKAAIEAMQAAEENEIKARYAEEAAAKKKADEQAAADATVAVATATIGSLSALNKAFSKNDEKGRRNAFKREKALGIASAVINTAKSAVSAYNSMAGIPFVGPVLAPIAAAAAIAAGAAQIKNITKQKYKGESGGGGGGAASGLTASGGGSAPSAPQFNTVGTSGFNQINESLNNNNRNPTKAYVVSGEVSSAQSLDRNRIKEATFP